MSDSHTPDPYETIKRIGTALERQLNEWVHDHLNKKEVAQLASSQAQHIAQFILRLQEHMEWLSIPLNFPTKNDVANVARLTMQVEEKLDGLEEQVTKLLYTIEKARDTLPSILPPAQPPQHAPSSALLNSMQAEWASLQQDIAKFHTTKKEVEILKVLLEVSLLFHPFLSARQSSTEKPQP
ncbi:hypothetical protein JQN58_20035 [Aneurinibacillus sp. BA2021]|nr:hypothetical protein [Aneurinibacillus sp. BA2021]